MAVAVWQYLGASAHVRVSTNTAAAAPPWIPHAPSLDLAPVPSPQRAQLSTLVDADDAVCTAKSMCLMPLPT